MQQNQRTLLKSVNKSQNPFSTNCKDMQFIRNDDDTDIKDKSPQQNQADQSRIYQQTRNNLTKKTIYQL